MTLEKVEIGQFRKSI